MVPSEANHGEDVKEYSFYLDSTPTHSYMKWLYKYPQRAYPYARLVEENRRRGGDDPEFELLDTGIFDDDRYFDVFVEYGKASPEDLVVRVTIENRGPDAAPLHVLPHLWFRNTWAWSAHPTGEPSIVEGPRGPGCRTLLADDAGARPPTNLLFEYRLGKRRLYVEDTAELLFTDNETNGPRVHGPGAQSRKPHVKDAFHRKVVDGEEGVTADTGTKACAHLRYEVPARGRVVLRMRLSADEHRDPLGDVDDVLAARRREADEFYAEVQPPDATDDERLVQRQAFAGMLWSKQIYLFDVKLWLDGDDPRHPPPESRRHRRNHHWRHLNSMRILSMPDKWEYPWFAAWDLAFQAVPICLVDPELAKEQLWLLLFEQFQHPSGQIPACEWEFSDLNPPVQAWAVWRVFNMDRTRSGKADRPFLERCFHKLLLNFAWWVNKVDRAGNNVFEGGFLGLDNIAVIDRSQALPPGSRLEQSDATGWMGMFCLNLMRIALELARENEVYEGLATKFFQHYIYVGHAMKRMGGRDHRLWDEEDGFFYDVLRRADGTFERFRVRSLVGLIPLYAVERLESRWVEPFAGVLGEPRLVPPQQEGHRRGRLPLRRARRRPDPRLRGRRRGPDARDDPAHPRPRGVPVAPRRAKPVALPPGPPVPLGRQRGPLRAGRVLLEDQGRQLELARTGLVPDLLPPDRVAAQARDGLRLELHGPGSGRRARPGPLAPPGRREPGRPHDRPLHAGRVRPPPGRGQPREVPARPALARPRPLPRVLPRRHGRRPRRVAPDRLDRAGRLPDRRVASTRTDRRALTRAPAHGARTKSIASA